MTDQNARHLPDALGSGGAAGTRREATQDASTESAPVAGIAQDLLSSYDNDALGSMLGLSMLLTDGLSLEDQLLQVAAATSLSLAATGAKSSSVPVRIVAEPL